VAEWLEEAIGIVITEYNFDRADVLPYFRPTLPPPMEPQLDLF
jgi:hypothetical protein